MAVELEQLQREMLSSEPLALVQYEHNVVVRDLRGYRQSETGRQPVWGERVALYHPVKSQLTRLDKDAWEVFDAYGERSQNGLGISRDRLVAISQELRDRWILLPADEATNVVMQPSFHSQAEVYVETTEACNFGCKGCATGADRYLSGQAITMRRETMENVLVAATRSAAEKEMTKIRFKWAGGEAMLPVSWRLIRDGQDVIAALRKLYPGIEISQVVLTNGSQLSEQVVKELADWGMHVSVSLWGIGEVNDQARLVRREQDTYPNIIRGVQRLHEAGISYNVNHVVTPENARHFGDYIRAMWDTQSEGFVGRGWNGNVRPIPVGINFFRPQDATQLEALNNGGYGQMVEGLRGGFEVMNELIDRGEDIQPLDKIDYLQLYGTIPSPCGSGFNYLAIGPRGVASCHEALFGMTNNLIEIKQGANLIDMANREYEGRQGQLLGPNVIFEGTSPTIDTILALHGGAGCPRTTRVENGGQLGFAASTAAALYEPIIDELLALETKRRIRSMGS